MRAILVLFDSLNRGILECYGSDLMETPNFKRLAERTLVYDNHYVGSLPCMPSRSTAEGRPSAASRIPKPALGPRSPSIRASFHSASSCA